MTQHCPSCAEKICPPSGRSKEILVIGDVPGPLDLSTGIPFSTHQMYTTGGKILRKELELLGVAVSQWRLCNLWLHEASSNEACFKAGYDVVLEEAKGKKAILLVGADPVKTFTGYSVSDVSGLQVDSSVLSAPIIFASVNPAIALRRSVGEIRFALTAFVRKLEDEKIL